METPWGAAANYYASGRSAFLSLLDHGYRVHRWRHLRVPSYFCQSVVAALRTSLVRLSAYRDGPDRPQIDFSELPDRLGSGILVVNYFGLRQKPGSAYCQNGFSIEDHTHDPFSPWAMTSQADWCVASLRKALPIPDGAVLWSPRGHPLPKAPGSDLILLGASADKLASMLLKALYLNGNYVEKEIFRKLALHGEAGFDKSGIGGMSPWSRALLPILLCKSWRQCRIRNHRTLTRSLDACGDVRVMGAIRGPGIAPFSGIIVCRNAEVRERLRRELIRCNIYPAVLWSLEQPLLGPIPTDQVQLSRTMLSIHLDMRYGAEDMERVASVIKNLCNYGDRPGKQR